MPTPTTLYLDAYTVNIQSIHTKQTCMDQWKDRGMGGGTKEWTADGYINTIYSVHRSVLKINIIVVPVGWLLQCRSGQSSYLLRWSQNYFDLTSDKIAKCWKSVIQQAPKSTTGALQRGLGILRKSEKSYILKIIKLKQWFLRSRFPCC